MVDVGDHTNPIKVEWFAFEVESVALLPHLADELFAVVFNFHGLVNGDIRFDVGNERPVRGVGDLEDLEMSELMVCHAIEVRFVWVGD